MLAAIRMSHWCWTYLIFLVALLILDVSAKPYLGKKGDTLAIWNDEDFPVNLFGIENDVI